MVMEIEVQRERERGNFVFEGTNVSLIRDRHHVAYFVSVSEMEVI
jgi:hypothetical protein